MFYNVTGFIEKNKDTSETEDFKEVLSSSTNDIISLIFQSDNLKF